MVVEISRHKFFKKSSEEKVLIALIAVLAVLYFFNAFTSMKLSTAIDEKISQVKEESSPVELKLVSITDSGCSECTDLAPLITQLKSFDFVNVAEEIELDFSSQEAKKLIEENEINRVPALLVFGELENDKVKDLWNELWDLKQGEGKIKTAYFNALPPPYVDVSSREVIGLVSLTELIDSSCEECFNADNVKSFFERSGVKFSEAKKIEFASSEAKKLIEDYSIKSLPAIIVSKNVLIYPGVSEVLSQIPAIELNDFILFESVFPPFKELASGEIKGLVKVFYLIDESCLECFDVSVMENILVNFGVAIDSIGSFDVSSSEGKKLIEKYSIESVPAMVLSPDAGFYLSSVWSQIGSIEGDEWFVLRKPELLGVYRELESGKVIGGKQEQSTEAETKINEITVEGNEFSFTPSEIKVSKGEKVKITFKNSGKASHDFSVEGLEIKTKLLSPGESEVIEFVPEEAGTFNFFCSVSGHKEAGMHGTLIVSEQGELS